MTTTAVIVIGAVIVVALRHGFFSGNSAPRSCAHSSALPPHAVDYFDGEKSA
jgi:hypothetical protein